MQFSTVNQISTPGNEKFFLSPQFPMQRQYEALRAFIVDEEPSGEVARRFGYSAGAFRVLCHQFRHSADKRASFTPGDCDEPGNNSLPIVEVCSRRFNRLSECPRSGECNSDNNN